MLPESLRIDLVHRRELGEVSEEHRALHDPVEAATGSIEHRREVVEDARGLDFDVRAHQLSCGWLERDLASGEDEIAGRDRLAVRADGLRRLVGGHTTQIHWLLLPFRERGGD